ncbi:MAG: hypothetical protein ACOC80_12995 [Petrotogales bacterium]
MSINGRYVKIATKFWSDEKTIEIDPNSKLLYIYILSCPHSNMAGYYRLPKPYIKADLNLTDKQLNKAFDELLSKGLIKYCEKSSVILIPNYYKYNSIQNPKQAIGAANRTSELPKNSLVEDYKQAVKAHADSYEEQLFKGLPKGFSKGLDKRSGKSDTDTDTDTEKDNKPSEVSDKSSGKLTLKKLDNGRYDYPDEFEKIWEYYPRHKGKKAGWRKWKAIRKKGVDNKILLKATKNYAQECKDNHTEEKFIKLARTFFGPDEHWRDYLSPPDEGKKSDEAKREKRLEKQMARLEKYDYSKNASSGGG